MSDLTVVIVTYERQPLVMETLHVLTQQSVVPDVIISDDGTTNPVMGHYFPVVIRNLWSKHTTYNRVKRFNEAVALVETPYVVLMDDDCLPVSNLWAAAHLDCLKPSGVVRGLFQNPTPAGMAYALPGWFSSTNLSLPTRLAQAMGPFDVHYSGRYAYEDNDLGLELTRRKTEVATGSIETAVVHRGEIRHEYHVGLEENKAYYIAKWGLR